MRQPGRGQATRWLETEIQGVESRDMRQQLAGDMRQQLANTNQQTGGRNEESKGAESHDLH